MTIVLFLLKSLLAMSILLLVYKNFLEKEKMHQFNRGYLIVALIASFVIPLLPTGISMEQLTSDTGQAFLITEQLVEANGPSSTTHEEGIHLIYFVYLIYAIVFGILGVKFIGNIVQLIKTTQKNETTKHKGAHLVLLNTTITPFTFLNYIYVNKKDYESSAIDNQLLAHELTHAEQRHSWDILFVEFLITLFWFNPVLRWYKTAIQLNHEFLADESVIQKFKTVKTYQYLLLDTIKNNKKISLASNINFHLTKKRLEMMTKESSSWKKRILVFSTVPILIGLMVLLGNPVMGQNKDNASSIDKDKYFENALIHFENEDGTMKVVKYSSLSEKAKASIPPPPPSPGKDLTPLEKGTVVHVSEDGKVSISKGRGDGSVMPPPPPRPPKAFKAPKPPKPPKPPKAVKAPKPPKPPKAVKAPKPPKPPMPPPPPPVTLQELADEGATFYIDGKLANNKEVKALIKGGMDNIETIHVKKTEDGKKNVYVEKK